MMDRSAGRRQLYLLQSATESLEQNRIPPPIRADVVRLLTLLMAEHVTADVALPVEAANE
jgi:hypothetical protein